LVKRGSTERNNTAYDFLYNPSDGKYYDGGSADPTTWAIDDSGTNMLAFPTQSNMPVLYFYSSGGALLLQFINPYYIE
jgi:hypothetical protein